MNRKEITESRAYQISKAALEHASSLKNVVEAFEAGAEWADNHPNLKDIVKESLTREDIRELYIIFAEVDTEIELCKTDIKAETIGYYQEVLKRFKKK